MHNRSIERNFFFIILALSSVLMFLVFRPYFEGLIIAAVFAVIFEPLYRHLKKYFIWPGLAATGTIIITVVLVLIPLFIFGKQIAEEAFDLYVQLTEKSLSYGGVIANIENQIHAVLPEFSIDLEGYIASFVGFIFGSFGSFFSGTLTLAINFFVGLFAYYYFLKDGPGFKKRLIRLSPLPDSYDNLIIDRLKLTINSVLKGTLVIALIQGFVASIGLTIFNVPNPALWGSVAAVAAMVPGVGTGLVMIPAVLFLFISGLANQALGLLLWGTLAVGLIDNFLGPKIIGQGTKIHPLFIILSVLGGVTFFGPFGFLFGPLTLSVFITLFDIYQLLVKES